VIPPHRRRCDDCRKRLRRAAKGARLPCRFRAASDPATMRHTNEGELTAQGELTARYAPSESDRLSAGFGCWRMTATTERGTA